YSITLHALKDRNLFFLPDTPTNYNFALSLHDALPIYELDLEDASTLIKNGVRCVAEGANMPTSLEAAHAFIEAGVLYAPGKASRSEEHTSELQSRENLVCRLLLEKKKS